MPITPDEIIAERLDQLRQERALFGQNSQNLIDTVQQKVRAYQERAQTQLNTYGYVIGELERLQALLQEEQQDAENAGMGEREP